MKKHHTLSWTLVGLCCLAIAAACSSSDTKEPTRKLSGGESGQGGDATTGKGGSTAQGGSASSAGGTQTAGGVSSGGGATSTAGTTSIAGAAGATGACYDEAKKCFTCSNTNAQVLNHCTDAKCVAFDNKTLTKLNADGSLPALP